MVKQEMMKAVNDEVERIRSLLQKYTGTLGNLKEATNNLLDRYLARDEDTLEDVRIAYEDLRKRRYENVL